uniref:Uncharacterized protein n=1 Tax=Anabas testudineus TaxID=64144 RepID=A0A7N6FLI0_ANATE
KCSKKQLNLSRNMLIEFSNEMRHLDKLETLYMNQNNIRSIPEGIFPHLRSLKLVKLSTNRLAKLPSDINQCTSITYLDLSKNCLQSIQPLIGLPKLEELLVEKNQLTELPSQLFQTDNCKLTVLEKKKNIEEKVKTMLTNRRMVLKQRKRNLEESTDPALFMDQVDELDCLLEYKLKVIRG